jgi:hypothetical protein
MERVPSPEEHLRMRANRRAWRRQEWIDGAKAVGGFLVLAGYGIFTGYVFFWWWTE